MIFNTNKDKGRAGMVMGIAYFGANGYTISIPLNDTQWYDFIAEKDGKFYTVQCKATGSIDNSISLRSSGGTKGIAYDNIIEHAVDYLFCLDKEQNMFVIPVIDIINIGNVRSISLRTEPSKFATKNTFDTSKYQVKF